MWPDISRYAHLAETMVREYHRHGVLLRVVGVIVVHQFDVPPMADTDDVVGRGEGLVACGQFPHTVEYHDAFLLDSLRVEVYWVGV